MSTCDEFGQCIHAHTEQEQLSAHEWGEFCSVCQQHVASYFTN